MFKGFFVDVIVTLPVAVQVESKHVLEEKKRN